MLEGLSCAARGFAKPEGTASLGHLAQRYRPPAPAARRPRMDDAPPTEAGLTSDEPFHAAIGSGVNAYLIC